MIMELIYETIGLTRNTVTGLLATHVVVVFIGTVNFLGGEDYRSLEVIVYCYLLRCTIITGLRVNQEIYKTKPIPTAPLVCA